MNVQIFHSGLLIKKKNLKTNCLHNKLRNSTNVLMDKQMFKIEDFDREWVMNGNDLTDTIRIFLND